MSTNKNLTLSGGEEDTFCGALLFWMSIFESVSWRSAAERRVGDQSRRPSPAKDADKQTTSAPATVLLPAQDRVDVRIHSDVVYIYCA